MLFSILYYPSILFSRSFFRSYFQAVTHKRSRRYFATAVRPASRGQRKKKKKIFKVSCKVVQTLRGGEVSLLPPICCTKASLKQHIYPVLPCISWAVLPFSWGVTLNLVLPVICRKHLQKEWGEKSEETNLMVVWTTCLMLFVGKQCAHRFTHPKTASFHAKRW